MTSKNCRDCGAAPPSNKILPSFISEPTHSAACVLCQKSPLCHSCADYGVVTSDPPTPPFEVKSSVCKDCFKKSVLLDWSRNEDIIEEQEEENDSSLLPVQDIIMLHGGGGCRLMYSTLAREIVAKNRAARLQQQNQQLHPTNAFRFRCILPDLPGHGTRMDETDLTTTNLIKCVIEQVVNKFCFADGKTGTKMMKPIVLGGSFGGYLAMELVGQHPDLFSAAVISVAGQNVGAGRGLAAGIALSIGRFAAVWSLLSSAKLASLVLGQVPWKDMDVSLLVHDSLEGGFYFKRQQQLIEFLQSTNSRAAVSKFVNYVPEKKQEAGNPVTMLFANGGADHRDMEIELVNIAKEGYDNATKRVMMNNQDDDHDAPLSSRRSVFATTKVPEPKLIVYDGASHFYSASLKYAKVFMNDVFDFVVKVAEANK